MTGTTDESIKIPSAETVLREKSQDEKSSVVDILSAAESILNLADLPAIDDVAKAQEKQVKDRNGAFRELFSVISNYAGHHDQLIAEMEYVQGILLLTPAERTIFQGALGTLRKLAAAQRKFSEEFGLSEEELKLFLAKSEEEQAQFVAQRFSANKATFDDLKKAAFSAYNILYYVDKIFELHKRETQALLGYSGTDKPHSSAGQNFEIGTSEPGQKKKSNVEFLGARSFGTQAHIMHTATRLSLPGGEVLKNLRAEPVKDKFRGVYTHLREIGDRLYDLQGINALCRDRDVSGNDKKTDRTNFLESEKAEQFLSFLGEDAQKIAYFRLLQRMHAQDQGALEDSRRKSILSFIGKDQNTIDNIKARFPFVAQSLDELLKASKGKEDEPETKENIRLALTAIKSLLVDILEPDFAAFTEKVEATTPQRSLDFELEEEVAIIPAESHSIAASDSRKPQLIRTASLEKLSAMLGEAAEAVATKAKSAADFVKKGRFFGKPADFCGEVPFLKHAQSVLQTVHSFQKIAKEYEGEPSFQELEGLEFSYKRVDDKGVEHRFKTIPTDFREGDSSEVRQKGKLLFESIPQNEGAGTGIKIPADSSEKAMHIAVSLFVESLVKEGQKEIFITVDPAAPDANELTLKYVNTILCYGAIPVLMEGDKELSVEETESVLEKMIDAETQTTVRKEYTFLVERYKADVDRIRQRKIEDDAFLKEFKNFMKNSPADLPVMTGADGRKSLDPIKIVSRLAQIALSHRNLTQDDFVDMMVDYIWKISPNKLSSYVSIKPEKIKAELKRELRSRLIQDPEASPQVLATEVFNRAAEKLRSKVNISGDRLEVTSWAKQADEDYFFLCGFDNFLEELDSFPSSETVTMYNPNIDKNIGRVEIAIELTRIALVNRNLKTKSLVSKMLDYAMKLPGAHPISEGRIEEIRKEAHERLAVWMLEADRSPETVGKKLFEFLMSNLKYSISRDTLVGLDVVAPSQKESPIAAQSYNPEPAQAEQVQKEPIDIPNSDVSTEPVAMSVDATDSESETQDFFDSVGDDFLDEHFIKESMLEQEQAEMPEIQALEVQVYAAPMHEELQKMQVQERITVQEPLSKGQVSEEIEVRKGAVLENSEDSLVSSGQLAIGMAGIALNEKEALLQKIKELEEQVAQLQKKQAQEDSPKTLVKSSAFSTLGNVLGENVHSSAIPQPPPLPDPNLNSAPTSSTEKAKGSVSASSNTPKPAMDFLAELKKGVVLSPVAESASADRQLPPPPSKPETDGEKLRKQLLVTVPKATSGLNSVSERKLKPLPPKPETDGQKLKGELLATVKRKSEDRIFLQAFDSLLLLQKEKLSTANHAIIMRDPNTGEELDEQKVLIRLAEVAPIDKGMGQEAFLARIIQFAWISPNHDSSVPLTEEKKAELKRMLQQKIKDYFDKDKSERAPIGQLVEQMVKDVRTNLESGRDSKNIEKNDSWQKGVITVRQKDVSPGLFPRYSFLGRPFAVNRTASLPEADKTTIEPTTPGK